MGGGPGQAVGKRLRKPASEGGGLPRPARANEGDQGGVRDWRHVQMDSRWREILPRPAAGERDPQLVPRLRRRPHRRQLLLRRGLCRILLEEP